MRLSETRQTEKVFRLGKMFYLGLSHNMSDSLCIQENTFEFHNMYV